MVNLATGARERRVVHWVTQVRRNRQSVAVVATALHATAQLGQVHPLCVVGDGGRLRHRVRLNGSDADATSQRRLHNQLLARPIHASCVEHHRDLVLRRRLSHRA